ncbi:MAG: HAD family hydrolase, partial [Anaerolineae bacterium]
MNSFRGDAEKPLSSGALGGSPSLTLIAVDLDGTLLRRDSTLAPEGVRALRDAGALGVHVVLATTRTPDSVRRFARQIGLHDPIICTNGAQVFASPGGPVWAHRALRPEVARGIAEFSDDRGWSLVTTV